MRQFLTLMLLLVAAFVALTDTAPATVINVAYWRGGENDVPAPSGTFGQANGTAVDGTGNGWDLTKSAGDGPFYAYPSDYPVGVGLPAGSTVDYAFDATGNNGFGSATSVATGTTNWGVQLYVRPNTTNSGQVYLQNGAGSGFALFQLDAALLGQGSGVQYYADIPNVADIPGGVVDTSAWHNLALVSAGNTISFYVDGTVKGSATGAIMIPTGFVGLGHSAAGQFYAGGIDEARIFTFAPGAFQVSDLNNYVVPEPSALILAATGLLGLLAYAWRKRR